MTNKNLCEVVCVIDKSGSMTAVRDDAVGGFNKFLEEQKKLPGKAVFSLMLFDTVNKMLYDGVDIQKVEPLNNETYQTTGMTALNDAVCVTIDAVGKRLSETKEADRPGKVIFCILTDGHENSSKEHSRKDVLDRIKQQQDKYQWSFLFLGANQDAFKEAHSMGISKDNTISFDSTPEGTRRVYRLMAGEVSNRRK